MATAKMAAKATVANFGFHPGESEAGATHLGELEGSGKPLLWGTEQISHPA